MSERFHFIDITYKYDGGTRVIFDTDLVIEKGEVAVIKGDNGVGKTTLIKVVGGLLKVDNATVNRFHYENKNNFWYMPNDRLFDDMSVIDYLYLCNDDVKVKFGNKYASFKRKVSRLIEEYGVDTKLNTLIKELSTGNRVYVRLLNLYLNKYDALFLDEPTDHLDIKNAKNILKLIKSYVYDENVYCVVSSHDARLLGDEEFMNVNYNYQMYFDKLLRVW